jgi:hypothetical protein
MTLTVESWCEALESGKFEQGRTRLRDGDRFCCLGVACDMSAAGEWLFDGSRMPGHHYKVVGRTAPHTSFLPAKVQGALDLVSKAGAFNFASLSAELKNEIRSVTGDEASIDSLIDLNDAGVPFPLIAKVIRARPKGLFLEGE